MSMTYEEYIAHDGLALAAAVRTGDVTAMELLEVAVARLEAVNPHINAVVHMMEEDARLAAERPIDGSTTIESTPGRPASIHAWRMKDVAETTGSSS